MLTPTPPPDAQLTSISQCGGLGRQPPGILFSPVAFGWMQSRTLLEILILCLLPTRTSSTASRALERSAKPRHFFPPLVMEARRLGQSSSGGLVLACQVFRLGHQGAADRDLLRSGIPPASVQDPPQENARACLRRFNQLAVASVAPSRNSHLQHHNRNVRPQIMGKRGAPLFVITKRTSGHFFSDVLRRTTSCATI